MEADTATESRKRKSIFSLDSDDEEKRQNDTAEQSAPSQSSPNSVLFDDEILEEFFADEASATEGLTSGVAEKPSVQVPLSAAQKAKIEKNRQRALLLRQARLQARPTSSISDHSVIRINNSRLVDSGGGFLIDENDLNEEEDAPVKISDIPAPIVKPDRPPCEECSTPFHDSFLYRSFLHPVCDSCKDEEKHQLITKTDARQEYLLKDCDLDSREPPLKFIVRKNPHNSRWGDMKLYLRLQVEKRAIEVWGSEEKIEQEHQSRDEKREKTKVKKFNKQIKALRMSVRSSMYKMKEVVNHQHEFGPEKYDSDNDVYHRSCKTCGYEDSFEKM